MIYYIQCCKAYYLIADKTGRRFINVTHLKPILGIGITENTGILLIISDIKGFNVPVVIIYYIQGCKAYYLKSQVSQIKQVDSL